MVLPPFVLQCGGGGDGGKATLCVIPTVVISRHALKTFPKVGELLKPFSIILPCVPRSKLIRTRCHFGYGSRCRRRCGETVSAAVRKTDAELGSEQQQQQHPILSWFRRERDIKYPPAATEREGKEKTTPLGLRTLNPTQCLLLLHHQMS